MAQGGNVAMHVYVQLLSRKEKLYAHSSVLYVQVSTGFFRAPFCRAVKLDGSGVYNMLFKVLCSQVTTGASRLPCYRTIRSLILAGWM